MLCFFLLFLFQSADMERILDLRGQWLFQKGDQTDWAFIEPDELDENWTSIFVPSPWENEGHGNYDGFAWYHTSFETPKFDKPYSAVLYLGRIDDVDEVYLNGRLIGKSGVFPPDYRTGFHIERYYVVQRSFFRQGQPNSLNIRVYDERIDGGIVDGKIGLYYDLQNRLPEIELSGRWKFKPEDRPEFSSTHFNDSDWSLIQVPGYWEVQGFPSFDGVAWYRTQFDVPHHLREDVLTLLLGTIDDYDQCFLNGEMIGETGDFKSKKISFAEKYYLIQREYEIPLRLLKPKNNVLAIRVYDGLYDGGIYGGQIGIVNRPPRVPNLPQHQEVNEAAKQEADTTFMGKLYRFLTDFWGFF